MNIFDKIYLAIETWRFNRQPFKEGKCVVINSGGYDSVVVLHEMKAQGFEVYSMFFDYGQKAAKREALCASIWARRVNAKEHIEMKISLPWVTSCLMKGDNSQYTYVPGRNLILLSYALSYAEEIDASVVAYGATKQIPGPNFFPDAAPKFISYLDKIGKYTAGIQVLAPLILLNKMEVYRYGWKKYRIDPRRNDIHSCYEEEKCGICEKCLDEAKAIAMGIFEEDNHD